MAARFVVQSRRDLRIGGWVLGGSFAPLALLALAPLGGHVERELELGLAFLVLARVAVADRLQDRIALDRTDAEIHALSSVSARSRARGSSGTARANGSGS